MKPQQVSECALCRNVRTLRSSHIVPAWGFEMARSTELASPHPLLIANGIALMSARQTREHLLCDACEQRFGRWDSYFRLLAYKRDGEVPFQSLLRNRFGAVANVPDLDVHAVIALAVSIVWRAHLCSSLPK